MSGNFAPALPVIEERINASDDGRISFADFMDSALYDSNQGYYTNRVAIGAGRDFSTWADNPVFGACVAEAVVNEWEQQDQPKKFTVLEMGAGTGDLAYTILANIAHRAPRLRDSLNYTIVEVSPHLMRQQQQKLGRSENVAWLSGSAADLELEDGSVEGMALSNELIDAFPVHRIARRLGGVRERFVTMSDEGKLTTVEGPLSEDLRVLPESQHVMLGFEKVVSPQMKAWAQTMGRVLAEGSKLITIDYGSLDRDHLFQRQPIRTFGEFAVPWRPAGLTPAVKLADQGPVHSALKHPGLVDITYDVNFSALRKHGEVYGLETEDFDLQARFLLKNGLRRHAQGCSKKSIERLWSPGFHVLQQRKVG